MLVEFLCVYMHLSILREHHSHCVVFICVLLLLLLLLFFLRRSKRSASDHDSSNEPTIPAPPELPVNEKAPWINIPSSNLAEDWGKLVNNPKHSDVSFELNSKTFHAHQLVLCASSDLFRAIFGIHKGMKKKKEKGLSKSPMWTKHRLEKVSMATANEGYVEGLLSVEKKQVLVE